MSQPTTQKDLRELPPEDQLHSARRTFTELAAEQAVEFLFSAPLYGFCISLLDRSSPAVETVSY